jgi:hypothetical protein
LGGNPQFLASKIKRTSRALEFCNHELLKVAIFQVVSNSKYDASAPLNLFYACENVRILSCPRIAGGYDVFQ